MLCFCQLWGYARALLFHYLLSIGEMNLLAVKVLNSLYFKWVTAVLQPDLLRLPLNSLVGHSPLPWKTVNTSKLIPELSEPRRPRQLPLCHLRGKSFHSRGENGKCFLGKTASIVMDASSWPVSAVCCHWPSALLSSPLPYSWYLSEYFRSVTASIRLQFTAFFFSFFKLLLYLHHISASLMSFLYKKKAYILKA